MKDCSQTYVVEVQGPGPEFRRLKCRTKRPCAESAACVAIMWAAEVLRCTEGKVVVCNVQEVP